MGTGARKHIITVDDHRLLTASPRVNIRVGSPPQWLSVLVSTAGQDTLVIGTGGCMASKCFSIWSWKIALSSSQLRGVCPKPPRRKDVRSRMELY